MQHDQEFYISVAAYGFFGMFIIIILLLVAWNLRLRNRNKELAIKIKFMKEERLNGQQKIHGNS